MCDDDRHVLCPVPKTGQPGDEWVCPHCGWLYRALDVEVEGTFIAPQWWPVSERQVAQ